MTYEENNNVMHYCDWKTDRIVVPAGAKQTHTLQGYMFVSIADTNPMNVLGGVLFLQVSNARVVLLANPLTMLTTARRPCRTPCSAAFYRPLVSLDCPHRHRGSPHNFAQFDRRSDPTRLAWQHGPTELRGPTLSRPRLPLSLQAFVALPAPQLRKQAQRQRSAVPPLMMLPPASIHSWGSSCPDLEHDLQRRGLSSPWAIAVKRAGSKISVDDLVNLSAFLITSCTVQYLAWIVLQLCDNPSADSRQQIDDVLEHLDLARNTLIAGALESLPTSGLRPRRQVRSGPRGRCRLQASRRQPRRLCTGRTARCLPSPRRAVR